MWKWYGADGKEAVAWAGVPESFGGRFALESHVRAFLEALYERRLSDREVRSETDRLIDWIGGRWWVHGGDREAPPSEAFVRSHLADWEREKQEATHTHPVEAIIGGLWVGVPSGLLLGWLGVPVPYAVIAGVALAVFAALMWPRWKRRGEIEWSDA